MKQPSEPNLKKFRITAYGESTYQWAPSKSDILQMLQQAGALDKDTVVEEVDPAEPEQNVVAALPPSQSGASMPQVVEPKEKIFTLPGGQKVKEVNGVMYSLEWTVVKKSDLIARIGCDDIKIEGPSETSISDMDISILDWVELQPEGEDNASQTDSDV